MEMTFHQYIQNPMGIANSVISNREMYRTLYTGKLNNIMVREMGHIDYTLYKGKKKYYVYFKIPSEVIEKFYYDVVIEFSEPKDKKLIDNTLENYNVKFYSNDPSFVFTFAHAFIKNNLFITELKDKMSPLAVKKVAEEKNPTNQVGYVKSLYFAWLLMKKFSLFNKLKWGTAKNINFKELSKNIMQADLKIAARQDAQKEKADKRRKEKNDLKHVSKDSTSKNIPFMSKSSKQVTGIRKTKSIGGVTGTRNVRKTKRI